MSPDNGPRGLGGPFLSDCYTIPNIKAKQELQPRRVSRGPKNRLRMSSDLGHSYVPFYPLPGVSLPFPSSGAPMVYLDQNTQTLPKVAKCCQVNAEAYQGTPDVHLLKCSGHYGGQTPYLRSLPLPHFVPSFTHLDQGHQPRLPRSQVEPFQVLCLFWQGSPLLQGSPFLPVVSGFANLLLTGVN